MKYENNNFTEDYKEYYGTGTSFWKKIISFTSEADKEAFEKDLATRNISHLKAKKLMTMALRHPTDEGLKFIWHNVFSTIFDHRMSKVFYNMWVKVIEQYFDHLSDSGKIELKNPLLADAPFHLKNQLALYVMDGDSLSITKVAKLIEFLQAFAWSAELTNKEISDQKILDHFNPTKLDKLTIPAWEGKYDYASGETLRKEIEKLLIARTYITDVQSQLKQEKPILKDIISRLQKELDENEDAQSISSDMKLEIESQLIGHPAQEKLEDFYEIEDEDSLVNMFIKNIKFREYDEESLPKSEPIEL